jgi:hypothetical protein
MLSCLFYSNSGIGKRSIGFSLRSFCPIQAIACSDDGGIFMSVEKAAVVATIGCMSSGRGWGSIFAAEESGAAFWLGSGGSCVVFFSDGGGVGSFRGAEETHFEGLM